MRIAALAFATPSRRAIPDTSTPSDASRAEMRLPYSSPPMTPTYFAWRPRRAHAAIAVAVWPPQRSERSLTGSFTSPASGRGQDGSR